MARPSRNRDYHHGRRNHGGAGGRVRRRSESQLGVGYYTNRYGRKVPNWIVWWNDDGTLPRYKKSAHTSMWTGWRMVNGKKQKYHYKKRGRGGYTGMVKRKAILNAVYKAKANGITEDYTKWQRYVISKIVSEYPGASMNKL